MATNKMASISNKKLLIYNQNYKLQIKGIIIIPSDVWSEHMRVCNDRAICHLIQIFIF